MRRCLAGLQIAPVRPVPVVSERVHTASRKGQTAGRSNVTQRSCHQTVLCSIEDYGSLFHLEIAWRSNTSRFLVDDCTSHLERKSSEQFQGKRKALIYRSYVNFWTMRHLAVAYRGDSNTPPPQISKALQNRAKLKPIVKTVKISEFWTPTPQDVRKRGSKILKLPPVRNCFTLAMTNYHK